MFQQINPNSEVSSSTSQKRVATSVNAGDSMSEPRGKVCKSNIIAMSMPGTSRTYDGNHSYYFSGADMIEEEPRLDRNAATEYHHILQPKLELVEKSQENEQQLPASTCSTPRKRKLINKLRWTENKVKKQNIKIKRLQTQSRRLKNKLFNVEDVLKKLQEKFAMTNENLESLKNINVQVCISYSLLKLVMPDVLHL